MAQASAGADPVSRTFAGGGSTAAQECFWDALARAHFCPGGPRLNFVVEGGQGAVLTRLLPQNEVMSDTQWLRVMCHCKTRRPHSQRVALLDLQTCALVTAAWVSKLCRWLSVMSSSTTKVRMVQHTCGAVRAMSYNSGW